MSISATISGNIKITDNLTGSTSLTKVLNNTFTGTIQSYGQSVIIGTGSSVITLPISPIEFLYIKNLSATAGTTVTVTWTPNGGTSANIITLDPGALIILSEVVANGITALTLISNTAGTPVEFILAG